MMTTKTTGQATPTITCSLHPEVSVGYCWVVYLVHPV